MPSPRSEEDPGQRVPRPSRRLYGPALRSRLLGRLPQRHRRFCSTACQNRVKTAAFRARTRVE
nr:CGNR zinc finger domain-containing protein [Nonomuraea terrae]